ncbi:metallophosphoesterase [Solirubrobacter ginsenosidimutans]|uniref:Metallophosphoesterase n=1 Tax=Solirubrobacter ginsenosidimutans TaxID=490573 RepID=A0A9X3S4R2_9ACTN|nr:metallophosphoesterase [Solirubrobacter ginsenosidimutans]MDA0160873.1 metallophosphoesterase [Solirubrobacter ginsenosidimutans]
MATKQYAVVLSDVHIGNNTPTCWYQASVHEPQLSAALAWILAHRESIREVVLLGDLFDVWTYPPSMRPPTMHDIITANPGMLGAGGPLAAVVRAFPGEVRLLLGNHDGSLTRADIDELNASLGGRIELVGGRWRAVTGTSGKRTVFTHGHHECMFNAPDSRSPWATIPIGHFVSRAIAYQLSRTLPRGRTAADLPGMGNPTGVDVAAILRSWNRRDDLAAFLIEYICRVTGMPQTHPVVMPGGATTTARAAASAFAGLFTLWLGRLGRWEDALRAANADRGGGDDLAYFGQKLAMQTASDLAVMGHTHSAVAGVDVSPVDYVNNGYACVARPDAPRTPYTFTQVDLKSATAQIMAVVPAGAGFGVAPARVRRLPSAVVHGRDYSSYGRIYNRTTRPLQLVTSWKDSANWWAVRPPALIPPQSRLDIWVQDTPLSPRGSDTRFSYTDGRSVYRFAITCPTMLSNAVSSSVPYETKVASGAWRPGRVDGSGYPVQARFYVGAAVPAPPAVPTPGMGPAVPAPAPASAPTEPVHVLAAREILARAGTPPERGIVLCVTRLEAGDGQPLLDTATDRSRTRLTNPPRHLLSPEVQTSPPVAGRRYEYVWIQPNVPPTAPPLTGGMAFLPAQGEPLTVVTFNVAGLDEPRRRCTNGHHAEMQLVGFVNAQPAAWRARLAKLALHNYSRRGPTWGYSACNGCLHDLAVFLETLNHQRRAGRIRASISWERLYDKNRACGHPTDAANIRRLVAAGWDEPMGPRPAGTRWPVTAAAPARPPALVG